MTVIISNEFGPEELFLRHFCKSLEMQQSIIMATLHLLRQQ